MIRRSSVVSTSSASIRASLRLRGEVERLDQLEAWLELVEAALDDPAVRVDALLRLADSIEIAFRSAAEADPRPGSP